MPSDLAASALGRLDEGKCDVRLGGDSGPIDRALMVRDIDSPDRKTRRIRVIDPPAPSLEAKRRRYGARAAEERQQHY
jgi:hypothetical protein